MNQDSETDEEREKKVMSEYVIFREDETGQLRLVERCSGGDCYMMGWTPKVVMSDIVPKTEMATFEGEHELCEYALRALEEEDDGQPKERDILRTNLIQEESDDVQ